MKSPPVFGGFFLGVGNPNPLLAWLLSTFLQPKLNFSRPMFCTISGLNAQPNQKLQPVKAAGVKMFHDPCA